MLKRALPPIHPGEILREDYIKAYRLTIKEAADGLGVARANLSAIVNGRGGISPEMAVKLGKAFGNSAQFWLNLQRNYDLWQAEQKVDLLPIRHFRQKTEAA